MSVIRKGTYQHFKGKVYHVVCTAKHVETGEDLAIYRGGDGKFWARSAAVFSEEVLHKGEVVPRFDYLEYSVPVAQKGRRSNWRVK